MFALHTTILLEKSFCSSFGIIYFRIFFFGFFVCFFFGLSGLVLWNVLLLSSPYLNAISTLFFVCFMLKKISSNRFTVSLSLVSQLLSLCTNVNKVILYFRPQNLIAQSQSGTGKTAAFVLAMLSRADPKKEFPQCLCLSPTFELAVQTGRVIEKMGRYCVNIKVNYAIRGNRVPRGTSVREQIIIGTPGTLLDWCFKLKLFNVKKIKVYVLDEADVLIDKQNFLDQSVRIQRSLSSDCQLLLFSATFEPPVLRFAQRIIPDPNIIALRREELTLSNIRQYYFECENKEDKFRALCNLYGSITIGQAIIFCQTRYNAKWLYHALKKDGHQVSLLSGELTVEKRAEVIQQFRDGKYKVLITTNICARGIDVMQVTIVVNFTMPTTVFHAPDFETYLHRIGRTGRFGKKGLAFNMVEKQNLPLLFRIQDHFKTLIQRLDPEDMEALEKIED
ncbi:ATP-dependent RNA helicase DDX25 isoform 1-T1 [Vipera latastei]